MDKIKLVIIDDSTQMKNFVSSHFNNHPQFELLSEVNDGAKAVETVDKLKPDIVLLDLVLPNRDGFAVLEDLQKLEKVPKTIVVTALSSSNFVYKAMNLGASYYMVKPLNINDLDRVILEQSTKNAIPCSAEQNKVNLVMQQFNNSEAIKQKNMDERLSNIFITVGIPAHIKGYQFLREAIKIAINEPDIINSITKRLYPNIASRFNTSASKVERAIRHAIEVAWNRGKIENINSVFGLQVYETNEKPTNGEFIALLADKMLVESC